jgi:hypothetical protein
MSPPSLTLKSEPSNKQAWRRQQPEQPRRCRWHFHPKRRLAFNRQRGVIYQRRELFISKGITPQMRWAEHVASIGVEEYISYRVFQKDFYKFERVHKIYSEDMYSVLKCHNIAKHTEFYLG